jgi:hypothetical protein
VPSFPLPPRLPLTPAGGIDHDRWGDQGAELQEARLGVLEGVWEYGGRDEAFGWMATPVINVVFALAACFVHTHRPLRGRAAKVMDIERVASCVRAGYAVRSFELTVGEPMLPFGSYLDRGVVGDDAPM